jgi:D-alanyl-D-alanine carboxypeptidase/D-alanyl-D-alanine-endopeptidase (penicillin-binding protein 4)
MVGQGDLTLGGRAGPDGKLAFRDFDHTYSGWLSTRTELTDTDPLAGLQSLARQIKESGIRDLDGEVLVDTRLFDRLRGTGSGPTAVTSILVNDNLIDLLITPGAKVGTPASVEMRPKTGVYQVEAKVETVAASTKPAEIRVEKVGEQRLKVRGKIPLGSRPLLRIFPVEDPALFARSLLIEALDREGVKVKADLLHPRKAELPAWDAYARLPRVAVHRSEPLSEVVKVVLKVSHNLYASTLPLLVAVGKGKHNHAEGMRLAQKQLRELGVDVERISLESGAGGGNGDRVTPRATVQLLQGMAKRPEFAAYKAGFPILGVDGTLVDVVGKDSPARGKVFAKTGTYGDADLLNDRMLLRSKALAGVMTTAGGRELVVAMFVNDVLMPPKVEPTREGKVLGRICEILYQHDAPAQEK